MTGWISKRLFYLVSVVALLAGIALVAVTRARNVPYDFVGYVIILASAAALLFGRFKEEVKLESPPAASGSVVFKLTSIVYIASIAAMVVLWKLSVYERPVLFFVLAGVAGLSILIDILHAGRSGGLSSALVLAKIGVLSALLSVTIFYNYPTMYGIDPWGYRRELQEIDRLGHIPGSEVLMGEVPFVTYFFQPVSLLLMHTTKIVTALSYKDAMFWSAGLTTVTGYLFVYLVARQLFSERTGLLAALFTALSNVIIYWSVQPIAFTTAFVPFLTLLYLVLRDEVPGRWSVLIVMAILSISLCHNIVSMMVLIALAALLVVAVVLPRMKLDYRRDMRDLSGLTMVAFLTTFTIWMFVAQAQPGQSFFESALLNVAASFVTSFEPLAATSAGGTVPRVSILLFNAGHMVLLLLAIYGVILLFKPGQRSCRRGGLTLVLLFFYGVMYGFPFLSSLPRAVAPGRWLLYIFPILSIFAGLGAASLYNIGWKHRIPVRTAVLLLTTIAVAFMITNPWVTPGEEFYAREYATRMGYTASEVYATTTLASINPIGARLMADDNFRSTQMSDLGLVTESPYALATPGTARVATVFVLRRYLIENPALMINSERNPLVIRLTGQDIEHFSGKIIQDLRAVDKVYDNGQVEFYLSPGAH